MRRDRPHRPDRDRDRAPDTCEVCGAAPAWDARRHGRQVVWLCWGCFGEAVELSHKYGRRRAG